MHKKLKLEYCAHWQGFCSVAARLRAGLGVSAAEVWRRFFAGGPERKECPGLPPLQTSNNEKKATLLLFA